MNIASKEWQGVHDAAQFQTFGEKLIREIIPHELEKERTPIAESPSDVEIEQAPEDPEIEQGKSGRFHV